jgi:hypothetical protein
VAGIGRVAASFPIAERVHLLSSSVGVRGARTASTPIGWAALSIRECSLMNRLRGVVAVGFCGVVMVSPLSVAGAEQWRALLGTGRVLRVVSLRLDFAAQQVCC